MDYLEIGKLKIEKTVAAAPMAGVADKAFRELCRHYKAAYTVGEMASAKGLCYNDKKTPELLEVTEPERPMAVQLFGAEPEFMAKAAVMAEKFCPDMIDINAGCPAPKVTGTNGGSSLLKDPKLCGEIVKAVVNATEIPVTIKIRKGWDDNTVTAVEVAKRAEDAGAKMIVVHGRTRKQMYMPPVDLDIIKSVKEAVSIPVVGNGDIDSPEKALEMMRYTGCDMVMIGRAALGHPWLFEQIRAAILGQPIPESPSLEQTMEIMRHHLLKLCEYKGEYTGMREARKHASWYIKGSKNAAKIRKMCGDLSKIEDIDRIIEEILKSQYEE